MASCNASCVKFTKNFKGYTIVLIAFWKVYGSSLWDNCDKTFIANPRQGTQFHCVCASLKIDCCWTMQILRFRLTSNTTSFFPRRPVYVYAVYSLCLSLYEEERCQKKIHFMRWGRSNSLLLQMELIFLKALLRKAFWFKPLLQYSKTYVAIHHKVLCVFLR